MATLQQQPLNFDADPAPPPQEDKGSILDAFAELRAAVNGQFDGVDAIAYVRSLRDDDAPDYIMPAPQNGTETVSSGGDVYLSLSDYVAGRH